MSVGVLEFLLSENGSDEGRILHEDVLLIVLP